MSQLTLDELTEAEQQALRDAWAMLEPHFQLMRVNLESKESNA